VTSLARACAAAVSLSALAIAAPASAFCGFYVAPTDAPLYNDASMVALMRNGTRTVLTMSNNYKGPAESFAMVVPVPVVLRDTDVKTLPLGIFKRLEALSAPRLVEYWEQDPCPPEYDEEQNDKSGGTGSKHKGAEGMMGDPSKASSYGVKIEASFVAGEYQIVVLGAQESDGLERWLRDNGYAIPAGAGPALAPYIAEQQKFFVAKVDTTKVQHDASGAVVLSPLRFSYESDSFRLPVRLGLINAQAKQDLIIYILADKRYDVANYTNVFIPTNIDVADATRDAFGPFYAELFDATLAKAGGRAVVTEYAWRSSQCDPCPTPPLETGDVSPLGGELLFGMPHVEPASASSVTGTPGNYYGGTDANLVLTRLHTRYDKATLNEDLVFRATSAVVGGRELVVDDATGEIERGVRPDEENNFQARYAIRHPWTGPIACKNPERGIWGGPPGSEGDAPVKPATDLASAPRGKIALASLVLSPVAELGLRKWSSPPGAAPGWRWAFWKSVLMWEIAPFGLAVAALVVAYRRRTRR
jgi:hypothetical protein